MTHPTDDDQTPPAGPYAHAAPTYWAAGWRGLLPLPPRAKKPVPVGWTGGAGAFPSYPDVHAWTEGREGAGNLALRLPHHVVGIDVDDYAGKGGGARLAELEGAHGVLPPTWRSTSRDDGVSGIRLYRVPEGLAWPGDIGAGIEIIQHRHRYTVVWPSVHPEGRTYRWIDPDGHDVIGTVPGVDDLPDLPEAWVLGITGGDMASDTVRAQLGASGAGAWLDARSSTAEVPCRAVRTALTRYIADLRTRSHARHQVALSATARLAHLSGEGHPGVVPALAAFKKAWVNALASGDDGRAPDPGEWDRMLSGAVEIAAAAHPDEPVTSDPCDNPFHGLLAAPPTRPGETSWTIDRPAPSPSPTSASLQPSSGSPTTSASSSASAGVTTGADAPADAAEPPVSSPTPLDPLGLPDERPRTSWWPKDLGPALRGEVAEEPPVFLARTDGQHLVYAGKVNGLLGESESGKSWIALHGVAQALRAGSRVTVLDFEDSETGIVSRLRILGVPEHLITSHLAYIGPDEALDALSAEDLRDHLAEHSPQLVVLDGVNAAMTLLGLNLLDNMDATKFAQMLLRPLANTGAAVLYVDHTPKDREAQTKGGIGAQAKRAMTTGAAFKVEVITAFGIGQQGKLRLRVDKDRPGHVRGASLPGKAGHWAGDVNFTPREGGGMDVEIVAGVAMSLVQQVEHHVDEGMRKVSDYLQAHPGRVSFNDLRASVGMKRDTVSEVVQKLADEGYIGRDEYRPGVTRMQWHIRPYDGLSGLVAPELSTTGPTSPRPVPDQSPGPVRTGQSDQSHRSPPYRGTGDGSGPVSSQGSLDDHQSRGLVPDHEEDR